MFLKNFPMRRLRVMAVLAAVFSVAACTSSLVYNRLDTVARWYIGNLVTLDDSQQASLRDWLSSTLTWHRDQELGRYEQFLRDLAGRISIGPDPTLYPAAVQQAERFVQELGARVAPEAASLLLTLEPSQVDELLANLAKRNQEEMEEDEGLSDADLNKRRVRTLTRNLEGWTGAVTNDQKAIMERAIGAMSASGTLGEDAEWLASQAAWRRELRAALATGAQGKVRVEALLRNPEASHTPAHREHQATERRQFLALVVELDATLTVKQRATLSRKLNELATDLSALARVS